MKESSTYQAVLEEGRLEEAKRFLFLMAKEHLGNPDASAQSAIEALDNRKEIEGLAKKLLDFSSWEELVHQATRLGMSKSPFYQLALQEGRVEEARRILLRLGRLYLGEPSVGLLRRLEVMTDLEAFETLVEYVSSATSWEKLIPLPTRTTHQARRRRW